MITFRTILPEDELLLLRWKNDPEALDHSFDTTPVKLEDHQHWFRKKLTDPNACMYIFESGEAPIGMVRFDKSAEEIIVGIVIDPDHRGKGYGSEMLLQSAADYFGRFPGSALHAYIKNDNLASIRSFGKAGFMHSKDLTIADAPSILMTKTDVQG